MDSQTLPAAHLGDFDGTNLAEAWDSQSQQPWFDAGYDDDLDAILSSSFAPVVSPSQTFSFPTQTMDPPAADSVSATRSQSLALNQTLEFDSDFDFLNTNITTLDTTKSTRYSATTMSALDPNLIPQKLPDTSTSAAQYDFTFNENLDPSLDLDPALGQPSSSHGPTRLPATAPGLSQYQTALKVSTVTPAQPQKQTPRTVPFSPIDSDNGISGQEQTSTQPSSSMGTSGQQTPYTNNLLGMFANPEVPLRIIDKFFSRTLPAELVGELASALNSQSTFQPAVLINKLETIQKEQRSGVESRPGLFQRKGLFSQPLSRASGYSTPKSVGVPYQPGPHERLLTVPHQTPRPCSGIATPAKVTKSMRGHSNKTFDPDVYYDTKVEIAGWSPNDNPNSKRGGSKLFEYTSKGEFLPGKRYTTEQIHLYLTHHPLNHSVGTRNSGLKLWIQNTPADSGSRYPNPESSKCRFENCPTDKGTIRTGEYRVCFEETWDADATRNPYHNAGYVHLYCLEKNFNFHELLHNFNVEPDTREHKFEPNPRCMSLVRDRATMLDVVEEYENRDPSEMTQTTQADRDNFFEKSLTRALTLHHVESDTRHIREQRQKRNGNDLSQHLGNLDMKAQYKRQVLAARKNGLATPKPLRKTMPHNVPEHNRKRRYSETPEPEMHHYRQGQSSSSSRPPFPSSLRRSSRNTMNDSPSSTTDAFSAVSGRRSPRLARKESSADAVYDDDLNSLFEDDEDDESDFEQEQVASKRRKY